MLSLTATSAGLFAAALFLRVNGYNFDTPDDLVYDETIAGACRERSIDEVARFFSAYCEPLYP